MAILTKALDVIQMGVVAYGGYLFIPAVMSIAKGLKEKNPAQQEDGWGAAAGGALIIIAGLTLIPMLQGMFTV